jgi:GxxExxY protein
MQRATVVAEEIVLLHQALTERIIGLAIEVHRQTGPGMLESFYAWALCGELEDAGIPFAAQVTIPAYYKKRCMPNGFRADIVVDGAVIIEVKGVANLVPAHEAQLLTYLRTSQFRVGLLMNFHANRLVDGLKRCII